MTPHFFGGGAERVAVILANGLDALGHSVVVLAGSEEGPNRNLLSNSVELVVAPPMPLWRFPLLVRDVVERVSPDGIISHQTLRNVPTILGAILAGRRKKVPIIVVEHGEIKQTIGDITGFSPHLMYWIIPLVYPFASRVLSVSANIQKSLPKPLFGLKMVSAVIENPVVHPPLEGLRARSPHHPWLLKKTGPVFIGLGRLEAQKNFDLLIDSFARVKTATGARLIIYGEGSLRQDLQRKIDSMRLADHVDLAGYVENPFAELAAADALVLSSTWEGLPTVAIEAMYCGAQVVSTRNSSGIELITESGRLGWLSELADVAGLAGNMISAIEQPHSREILQKKASEFDYKVVSEKYLAIVRSES